MTEPSRKAFEIFVDDKGYCEFSTQIASEAWQASEARILTLLDSPELFDDVRYILNSSTVRGSHTDAVLKAIKQKIGE